MKMKPCLDHTFELSRPLFQKESDQLFQSLSKKTSAQLLSIYNCSQRTFIPVYQELQRQKSGLLPPLAPALLAFEGIAFRYMAPGVFSDDEWEYINQHLRILSGRYGVLRPLDGVVPYRLEMKHKIPFSLYEFWGDKLQKALDDETIINLASKEYSRAVSPYQKLIDVRFFELENGRCREKGVYAKMARGSMVRWMAENRVTDPEQLKAFDLFGYRFDQEASSAWNYVFVRKDSHERSECLDDR